MSILLKERVGSSISNLDQGCAMKITFLGATQNVTGSRFMVQTGSSALLIDCGIFQERGSLNRNWEKFPFNPQEIDAVILTHAHGDHCGYLPKLVREGFKGKIYCTPPTADIAKISLLDSAHLQEADAEMKRKRHKKEGRKGAYEDVPLYTVQDALKVFSHFSPVGFQKMIVFPDGIQVALFEAGHILGAAMVELRIKEGDREQTLIFSGDIGRWQRPLLCDPHIFQSADYVIMEATYGDKRHEEEQDCLKKLEEVIRKTHRQGGNVVIPVFAIGRAQELLYDLNQLINQDRIPNLLTFVDSPMAMEITKIFEKYPGYFDEESQGLLRQYDKLFDFPLLQFTPTVNESKAINYIKGTSVIMASSGMCTGGRIKHHLVNNISRPESTILFVGFQAEGTLGRAILEKPDQVRIFGEPHIIRADIERIEGFSAHADQTELLRWITGFEQKPKKIFIVHSEKETARHFAEVLKHHIASEVIIPSYKDEHDL